MKPKRPKQPKQAKIITCPKCGKPGELHILSGASYLQDDYEVWHGEKSTRLKPIGPAQIPASVVTTESRCILEGADIAKLKKGQGKQ